MVGFRMKTNIYLITLSYFIYLLKAVCYFAGLYNNAIFVHCSRSIQMKLSRERVKTKKSPYATHIAISLFLAEFILSAVQHYRYSKF